MGYTTRFTGVLTFYPGMTLQCLQRVKECLKETNEFRCDLIVTDDLSGLTWDTDSEKWYHTVEDVTTFIRRVREEFPDFSVSGTLAAQGEDFDDIWDLVVTEEGLVSKVPKPAPGVQVECPLCRDSFWMDTATHKAIGRY